MLLSINQAAAAGIERLRKPVWVSLLDHIKVDVVDGKPGPWLHLWCPINKECNGRDPIDVLAFGPSAVDLNEECFLPYTGPLPESDEYREAAARYEGNLS